MSAPSAYRLQQAMSVLQSVAARMSNDGDIDADSSDLIAALQAEAPDCMDVVHRLIRAADEAGAMADATKARLQSLSERKARFERRKEAMRGALLAVMDVLDQRRLESAEFTVTVKAAAAQPIVTDEAALPEEYWRVKRDVNLAAIREAVKDGVVVPGIGFSNSAPQIQIRKA